MEGFTLRLHRTDGLAQVDHGERRWQGDPCEGFPSADMVMIYLGQFPGF
jgi:hypothetical protein